MKLALTLFALLSFNLLFAQRNYFQLKAGGTYNEILTNDYDYYSPDLGFSFGLGLGHISNRGLTFNVDLNFIQKNSIIKFNNPQFGDLSFSRNYLGLPISVGYQLGEENFVYANAGLAASYNVLAYVDNTYEKTNETWQYAMFELSVFGRVGGGVQIKENFQLFGEASIYRGLTPYTLREDWDDEVYMYRGFIFEVGFRYTYSD